MAIEEVQAIIPAYVFLKYAKPCKKKFTEINFKYTSKAETIMLWASLQLLPCGFLVFSAPQAPRKASMTSFLCASGFGLHWFLPIITYVVGSISLLLKSSAYSPWTDLLVLALPVFWYLASVSVSSPVVKFTREGSTLVLETAATSVSSP